MRHNPFIRQLDRVERHYMRLFRRYGDTPEAAEWTSRETREHRFAILAEVGDLPRAKILDFGCGTGELLGYLTRELSFRGEYVGWDLSEVLLEAARAKFPGVRFERREILSAGMFEDFDYILASGTFNNDFGHAESYMREALQVLFRHARCAIAFNLLSAGSDSCKPGLYYAEPEAIFRFCCRDLAPLVTLRHDYRIRPGLPPCDFTVYVYRRPGERSARDPGGIRTSSCRP